ncbi:hypothetical protein [Frondihabitans sp. PAMC 28766]|uniref:hypothetical protein n=1 Tax=Frondihabitans sp. PAMC 28766 TaxID=1795630 RepID=UPI0012FFB3F1|nr:hypothetical protein [Frondihabitans sp. PAMC 28766]
MPTSSSRCRNIPSTMTSASSAARSTGPGADEPEKASKEDARYTPLPPAPSGSSTDDRNAS